MLSISNLKIQGSSKELNLNILPGETAHFDSMKGRLSNDFFNTFIGVERPKSGDVLFDDVSLYNADFPNLAMNRRKIGCIFNRPIMLSNLTMRENMKLVLFLHNNKKTKQDFLELIEEFELDDFLDKRPSEVNEDVLKTFSYIRLFIINPKFIFIENFSLPNNLEFKKNIASRFKKLREGGSIFSFFGVLEYFPKEWVKYQINLETCFYEVRNVG